MYAPQTHPLICLPQHHLKCLHVPAAIYRHPRLWDPVLTTSRHDFPLAQRHDVAIKHILAGKQAKIYRKLEPNSRQLFLEL
jgi:hypothetical protein